MSKPNPDNDPASVSGAPRKIELNVRRRDAEGQAVIGRETVDPARAAVVVVDMTGVSDCRTTNRLTAEAVAPMNETFAAARKLGMKMMFMPGSGSQPFEGTPAWNKALALPQHAPPPAPPWSEAGEPWPGFGLPEAFAGLPYYDLTWNSEQFTPQQGNAICNCARTPDHWDDYPCRSGDGLTWSGQHPDLTVAPDDYLSENPQHLWNLICEYGISHLLYTGGYTNVCASTRYFGMWNFHHAGAGNLLIRDLTLPLVPVNFDPYAEDPVYDPGFTRESGLENILAFIEGDRGVAGTIDRAQIIRQTQR